jgi:ATP-binding cassette subfamily B protein
MFLTPFIASFYKPLVYYAIKLMVDVITNVKYLTIDDLIKPLLLYVVADVFFSTIWRISSVLSYKSEPYVQRGIITRALNRTLSFHYSFFQNTQSGLIVSKIKGLLEGYNELWAQLWYGVTFWLIACITIAFSIFFVSFELGLVILLWSAIFIVINYFCTIRINKLAHSQNTALHQMIGQVSDSLNNLNSVKLFSGRKFEQQLLEQNINQEFIPKEVKLLKFRLFVDILNDALSLIMLFIMIIIMIELKRRHLITVGDFVFVIGMAFIFQDNIWHLMQEFHKLSNQIGDLRASISLHYADNSEYLADNNTPLAKYEMNPMPPKIEFKHVSFGHPGYESVFSDLNLTINPGQKIGIVGYTGVGKTTLINLLVKIITPQRGNILINGQDINEIDNDNLRDYIAIVPQDINLFHRNLFENIRYGNKDATDEQVIEASKKAYAHEFISLLPEKYDTIVGERGLKLSGGQRQRIALARAILKDSPIIILDEATSSLDSVTEHYVHKSINNLITGKTVIAIAHRLSTIKNMDKLIVIDSGKIIETGTHEELLSNTNGFYYNIWSSQL